MRFWLIASGVAVIGAALAALLIRSHLSKRRASRRRERLKAIHPFLAGPPVTIRRSDDVNNDDSDA
ncbi:MAG TPA: hypothetical protein VH370_14700 [Humisphaera sp.]|jgi:hypothetical protein|nr:hypothetical protein [Humisphaera sp.]